MPRTAVVCFAIASLVLAGCTSDSGEPAASATTASAPSTSASGSSPTAGAPNQAPTANLTADVTNGMTPLAVNFTISVVDPDGDDITWTLDADGDGTGDAFGGSNDTLANFTYASAGTFNATLNVTDGEFDVSVVVAIDVANGVREPVVLATYTATGIIAGVYALTNDPNAAFQCPGFAAGVSGYGCVFLPFTKGPHAALPAIVTTNAVNVRLAFWTKCDPTGSGVGFFGGSPGGRTTVPATAGCGVAWSSNTGDTGQTRTFTLTVYDWLPPPA